MLIQLVGVIVNSVIAFFALFQVRIIRKEITILEKQAVFARLQIYPIINARARVIHRRPLALPKCT